MLKTKKDYEDCLLKIISPVKAFFTEGGAGIKCGATGVKYGEEITLMEGFARLLWGLAPFWGGSGENKDFEELYIRGIVNGTDPAHKEYWGEITDLSQKLVESAAFGLGLILAPHKIWEPLSEIQKDNFYNWLEKVNTCKCVDNNWNFFPTIVNLGFKMVGREYNKSVVEKFLLRIERYYKGNGWYTDGDTTQADYYISFAIHFYSLIYSKVMEHDDPKRCKIYKERANLFAKDFIYWFDSDGAALAFGRSLTYRFAQCCFWSACVFAEIEPFPMGVIKGIISRNLEWWLNHPIFDNGGVLSVGYAYPNINMAEEYNSFCSPYWALKAFLILAVDAEHPFFKAEVLPLPELEEVHPIPEAKMVIQRINGYVTAITAGQWAAWNPIHVAEKYSKFVYSSKYAFSIPRSYFKIENAGTDNMLTFVKNDMCYVRRECIDCKIEHTGCVYSKWSPLDGVVVESYIIPTKTGHIRKHIVVCDEECSAYDCSFAGTDNLGCVYGPGEKVLIKSAPNSNLINPLTQIAAVKYNFPKGRTLVETEVVYP